MAAYEDSSPEIIPEGEKINTIPDEYIPEEIQQEMAAPEQPQIIARRIAARYSRIADTSSVKEFFKSV